METLPIISWLKSMEAEQREAILNEQGMMGHMAYHYPELIENREWLESHKRQRQKNMIHEQESLVLKDILAQHHIKVIFLKGITLLEDLYPDVGSRVMSDVDCYVSRLKFDDLNEILIPLGYRPHDEKRWLGNKHKCEYIKETALGNVCFEFHNKLFWHREDPSLSFINERIPRLGKEEALVYLVGHYAFLHSCQKLYWLWDIYLFLKTYQEDLKEDKVHSLLAYFGFEKSFVFVCSLLKDGFNFECSLKMKKGYYKTTKDHFFSDRQTTWSYYFLKYFLKDKWSDNVRYTLAHILK